MLIFLCKGFQDFQSPISHYFQLEYEYSIVKPFFVDPSYYKILVLVNNKYIALRACSTV